MDSQAGYDNEKYYHQKAQEEDPNLNNFPLWLYLSNVLAFPVADSLPNCYSFTYSVYETEKARFLTFNSNWGNFFLAFLFNQMGNALDFQTKFANIEILRERQNYAAVWQEYGDLAYLIWNFQPIEEASLNSFETYVERWMADHEWLNDDTPQVQRKLMASSVATASQTASQSAGSAFAVGLAATQNVLSTSAKVAHRNLVSSVNAVKKERTIPKVGVTTAEVGEAANGFFIGMVDVFPYESNPKKCQTNATQGYTAFDHLFLNYADYQLGTATSQLEVITDVSNLLRFPYGITYSCYYGYEDITQAPPTYDDLSELTP